MPKTVQIRDIDDGTYAGLVKRAAEIGVTVPELLRIEATRLATRPSVAAWLEQTRRRTPAQVDASDVISDLDELRGPRPDADR